MNKKKFISFDHDQLSTWRSIILIGDNDKCYKFALGKSLLHFSNLQKTEIPFEDFIDVYTSEICNHLKKAPVQGSNRKPNGKVINSCISYNKNEISKDKLIETIKKDEWVVFKKFHLIKGGYVDFKYFDVKKILKNKKIILTDDMLKLKDNYQFNNLVHETDGRWNLLERSWELKIPEKLLLVESDASSEKLFVRSKNRRLNITGSRKGLNGYHNGKCFYCNKNISIKSNQSDTSDVDHFFPLVLEERGILKNLNGVWNLVLACKSCNRGSGGKFDRLADLVFLEKLEIRNNNLILSHDPLRQTLMMQTGKSSLARNKFLNSNFYKATEFMIHSNWKPRIIYE